MRYRKMHGSPWSVVQSGAAQNKRRLAGSFLLHVYLRRDDRFAEPRSTGQVTLPSGYNADSNIPTSVDLVIKGTQERIYMIEVDDIHVSVDFSNVDHEGVNMAPVVITMDGPNQSLDTSSVSIFTNPTQVKIYFSLKGSQEAI